MQSRRHAVLQGRKGRGDALHRQRSLPAGRIRYRTAGRRHRRRARHVFASNLRTQSLECIEEGMILSVSYDQVEQLYVQNPAFGFYLLKLSSARLFQNLDTIERRLAQQKAQLDAARTA